MRYIFPLALILTLSGCGLGQQAEQQQAQPTIQKANQVAEVIHQVDQAAQAAEPAIDAVEQAAGTTVSVDTAGNIESGATKAQGVVGKVGTAVGIGAKVPGPWQPYLGGLAGILAALNGLLGTVAAVAHRRRKKAEGAFATVAEGIESAKRKDPGKTAGVLSSIEDKANENGNLADVKNAVRNAL